jgi:uncharacterized protein (TIGR02145 family)
MQMKTMPFLCLVVLFNVLMIFSIHAQDSIADHEGNSYRIAQLGDQVWMTDNLRTSLLESPDSMHGYIYQNDPSVARYYGKLYSWSAAMAGSNNEKAKGICPKNWHIPSDQEWSQLMNYFGGIEIAGIRTIGIDSTAFIRFLCGNYLPEIDTYSYKGQQSYFWTSTSYAGNTAWMYNFGKGTLNARRSTVSKKFCFSVRCVKDE